MLIDMDARGNKLSSCQIPDHYLKKQKSYWTFRTLDTLAEKGEKKKEKNSEYKRVVITTLKMKLWIKLKVGESISHDDLSLCNSVNPPGFFFHFYQNFSYFTHYFLLLSARRQYAIKPNFTFLDAEHLCHRPAFNLLLLLRLCSSLHL